MPFCVLAVKAPAAKSIEHIASLDRPMGKTTVEPLTPDASAN